MLIDSHMHLGEDLIFNTNDSEEDLLSYMNEHGIDAAILQTGIRTYDAKKATQRVYDMIQRYPGKFWGAAVHEPYCTEEEYYSFMRWAIKDLGFKALKLHTFGFCASPTSPQAHKIFETAKELKVPVIIHTGNGVPAALPSLAIPLAKEFPDVKIVLAHSGNSYYAMEAQVAAQTCENIFLETSWINVLDLKSFVETLGCSKLMFGVDIPLNAGVELAKYRALKLTDEQYEQCFWKTATEVFALN